MAGGHPEADRDLIEKQRLGCDKIGGAQIVTCVKFQLIGAGGKFACGQDLLVGASVVIGGQAAQMDARVAFDPVKVDLQPFRGAAAGGVQHMGGQKSGHFSLLSNLFP